MPEAVDEVGPHRLGCGALDGEGAPQTEPDEQDEPDAQRGRHADHPAGADDEQRAADRRTEEGVAHLLRGEHAPVGRGPPLDGDERRHHRRGREVDEHLGDAVAEGEAHEQPDREVTADGEHGERHQQQAADAHGDELHVSAVDTVDEDAGQQPEHEPRQPDRHLQHRDLDGGAGQRDGEQRDTGGHDAVGEVGEAGAGQVDGERATERRARLGRGVRCGGGHDGSFSDTLR